ncbi:MAG: IS3 family transposase [Verrucomicrobiota bacterium]
MENQHDIADLCDTLNVSRSGYHGWKIRQPSLRAQANGTLLPLIAEAFAKSRETYGSPRICHWLRKRGQRCGRNRVARLMRGEGWRSQSKRRYRVSLTDSHHDLPIAPNRLRNQIAPLRRDAVWVADITYVDTEEGWLYVAGVLDRCTRRCVGWAMGDTLATTLPLAALEMALTHRKPAGGLVHHSDRGVQYASEAYRQRLTQAGILPSMSRRGNCYDNAAMESFWSSLKRELVHRRQFATRQEARTAIFEWIEIFYNRERLHSALDYKSPVDFENQLN